MQALQRSHGLLWQEIAASSSTKRQESVSQTSAVIALFKERRKLVKSSREHKELTKSIITCLDMLPLNTVDKPGFTAMIQGFAGTTYPLGVILVE